MDGVKLQKSKEEVDLGVTVTENLTPDRHIDKIAGEMMNLLKRVRMAFSYLDVGMMKKLLISMIRPRLEYAAVVWSFHIKRNIIKFERVQRAVTKMVLELSKSTYEERLRMLEIPTLKNRRERKRGDLMDLIHIYRMITGMENVDKVFYKF